MVCRIFYFLFRFFVLTYLVFTSVLAYRYLHQGDKKVADALPAAQASAGARKPASSSPQGTQPGRGGDLTRKSAESREPEPEQERSTGTTPKSGRAVKGGGENEPPPTEKGGIDEAKPRNPESEGPPPAPALAGASPYDELRKGIKNLIDHSSGWSALLLTKPFTEEGKQESPEPEAANKKATSSRAAGGTRKNGKSFQALRGSLTELLGQGEEK